MDKLRKEKHLAPGDLFANQYKLEEVLGEGGMGLVFKAKDQKRGITVALKLLLQKQKTGGSEILQAAAIRLRDEARAAAKLNHRGLVKIFDAGEDDHYGPYIVYEYLSGGSLASQLEHGGMGFKKAIEKIAVPLLNALAELHENNILHRDVKPENIFLSKDGVFRLGDFGLAKFDEKEAKTKTGGIVGTLAYIAPDRVIPPRSEVDESDDCYAAAHTIIEAITGKHFGQLAGGYNPFLQLNSLMFNADDLAEHSIPLSAAETLLQAIHRERTQRYFKPKALLEGLVGLEQARTLTQQICAIDDTQLLKPRKKKKKRAKKPSVNKKETSNLRPHIAAFVLLLSAALLINALLVGRQIEEPSSIGNDKVQLACDRFSAALKNFARKHGDKKRIGLGKLIDETKTFQKLAKENSEARNFLRTSMASSEAKIGAEAFAAKVVRAFYERDYGIKIKAAQLFEKLVQQWREDCLAKDDSAEYELCGHFALLSEQMKTRKMTVGECKEVMEAGMGFIIKCIPEHLSSHWYGTNRCAIDLLYLNWLTKELSKKKYYLNELRKPYSRLFHRMGLSLTINRIEAGMPAKWQRKLQSLYDECLPFTRSMGIEKSKSHTLKLLNEIKKLDEKTKKLIIAEAHEAFYRMRFENERMPFRSMTSFTKVKEGPSYQEPFQIVKTLSLLPSSEFPERHLYLKFTSSLERSRAYEMVRSVYSQKRQRASFEYFPKNRLEFAEACAILITQHTANSDKSFYSSSFIDELANAIERVSRLPNGDVCRDWLCSLAKDGSYFKDYLLANRINPSNKAKRARHYLALNKKITEEMMAKKKFPIGPGAIERIVELTFSNALTHRQKISEAKKYKQALNNVTNEKLLDNKNNLIALLVIKHTESALALKVATELSELKVQIMIMRQKPHLDRGKRARLHRLLMKL